MQKWEYCSVTLIIIAKEYKDSAGKVVEAPGLMAPSIILDHHGRMTKDIDEERMPITRNNYLKKFRQEKERHEKSGDYTYTEQDFFREVAEMYHVYFYSGHLNEMGKDGWELIQIRYDDFYHQQMWFKRPLEE